MARLAASGALGCILVPARLSGALMSEKGHPRRDWLRATIGPRPLRPESDHSRQESEMARWTNRWKRQRRSGNGLPKRINNHLKAGAALIREAKGLARAS